ncbi:MAG: alpha/beta hydrolase [Bacteroidota bacterium]
MQHLPYLFLAWCLSLFLLSCSAPSPSTPAVTAPPPFQLVDTLVDLDTHPLHFSLVPGRGMPILFESGGGSDASVWRDLLAPLYDSLAAPLITYDRAGFGQSGIDTNTISIDREIEDLDRALRRLSYDGALLVVNHSLGGVYTHLLADRHPERLDGAVFIDASIPCYETEARTQRTIDYMASFGIENIKAQSPGFLYIFQNYRDFNRQLRAATYPAGTATTVIGADRPPTSTGPDSLAWKACQMAFGQQPGHRFVLAENSGHQVFREQPQLVIDEIVRLYRQLEAPK